MGGIFLLKGFTVLVCCLLAGHASGSDDFPDKVKVVNGMKRARLMVMKDGAPVGQGMDPLSYYNAEAHPQAMSAAHPYTYTFAVMLRDHNQTSSSPLSKSKSKRKSQTSRGRSDAEASWVEQPVFLTCVFGEKEENRDNWETQCWVDDEQQFTISGADTKVLFYEDPQRRFRLEIEFEYASSWWGNPSATLTVRAASLPGESKGARLKVSPLILIHGFAGTRLQYKLAGRGVLHTPKECAPPKEWDTLWVSVSKMLFGRCLYENMKLEAHPGAEQIFGPRSGVDVNPEFKFGDVSNSEYLSSVAEYLHPTISAFEKVGMQAMRSGKSNDGEKLSAAGVGFVPKYTNLFGASYDFRRLDQKYLTTLHSDFKWLIEQAYAKNNNKGVVLMSHSLGCMETLLFLNRMDADWVRQHVKAWIAVGGPFRGAVKMLRTLLSGDDLDTPVVVEKDLAKTARTWATAYMCMPLDFSVQTTMGSSISAYNSDARTTREMSNAVLTRLFHKAQFDAAEIDMFESVWSKIGPDVNGLKHNFLKVYAVAGTGTATEVGLSYVDDGKPSGNNGGAEPWETPHMSTTREGDAVVTVKSAHGLQSENVCEITVECDNYGDKCHQKLAEHPKVLSLALKVLRHKESDGALTCFERGSMDTTDTASVAKHKPTSHSIPPDGHQ